MSSPGPQGCLDRPVPGTNPLTQLASYSPLVLMLGGTKYFICNDMFPMCMHKGMLITSAVDVHRHASCGSGRCHHRRRGTSLLHCTAAAGSFSGTFSMSGQEWADGLLLALPRTTHKTCPAITGSYWCSDLWACMMRRANVKWCCL